VILQYAYQETWIGGTYYIENLIAALNRVDEGRKPRLVIFARRQDFERLAARVSYPYYEFVENRRPSFLVRALNKAVRLLTGHHPWILPPPVEGDFVFPADWSATFRNVPSRIFWIPDLQDVHLPQMFSSEEIATRARVRQEIVDRGQYLVFSSQTAQKHFNLTYPSNRLQQFVMPFAVTLPPPSPRPERDLRTIYGIEGRFLMCSNQFWKHKNHALLIRTIGELVGQGSDLTFCFTGNESDRRHPGYFQELKALVAELGLEKQIRFLGFIPRSDQLGLMGEAIGVIQPSLFEGWSTVVEDAKALGVPLVVSDIEVHREQLVHYPAAHFFAPESQSALLGALVALADAPYRRVDYPYQQDVLAYGARFLEMLESIGGKPC
jgi:glycosyltransferase involved in cell wall biosynthesis